MEQYQSFLRQVLKRTGRNFMDYVKAMVILSVITFVITGIGLRILNVEHFILKSLLVAVVDALPVLGAGAVLIPWIILRVVTGELTLAAGLGVIFVIVVVVRQLAAPYIVGKSLGIRPIFTVIIFLLSWIIAGPAGIVFATVVILVLKSMLDISDVKADARREKLEQNKKRLYKYKVEKDTDKNL